MATVKDATLTLSNLDADNSEINNVRVTYTTVFSADEAGKPFRVKIDLYEKRSDRPRRAAAPFLTFKYGLLYRNDYYVITSAEGETIQTPVVYPVKDALLDTNPGRIFVDRNHAKDRTEFFSAIVSMVPDLAPAWSESPTVEHIVGFA